MSDSLLPLARETAMLLRAQWKQFLAGIAVGGFLLFTAQSLYLWKLQAYRLQYIEGVGVSVERSHLLELERRSVAGDAAAAKELKHISAVTAKRLQVLRGRTTRGSVIHSSAAFLTEMGPALVMEGVLFIVILGGSALVFFLQASEGRSPLETLRRAAALGCPAGVACGWMFLLSFLWVPVVAVLVVRLSPAEVTSLHLSVIFLGYFCAIILLPRFSLVPLLLSREGRRGMSALYESFDRTYGYWGKILGNLLAAFVAAVAAFFLVSHMLETLLPALSNPLPSLFVQSLAVLSGLALWTAFYARLSLTIADHPIVRPVEEGTTPMGLSPPAVSRT